MPHLIILRVVSPLVLGYRDTTMDLCIAELNPRYLGLRLYRRNILEKFFPIEL
jgi:hypothetical protein